MPREVDEAPSPPELLVVMPVYNEEACICNVATEWFREIQNHTDKFGFLAINDGSTDDTLKLLEELRERLGHRFEILDQPNLGHGQSCIQGYRIAAARGVPYVFQIDSDGQCGPQYFGQLWRKRQQYDVIYGRRTRRDDGFRRVLVSQLVQFLLLLRFGVNCPDANVPYRLMRTAAIAPLLAEVPKDFFLANIALAVLLRRAGRISHDSVLIRFGERCGGEPIPLKRLGSAAITLYRQTREMLKSSTTPRS